MSYRVFVDGQEGTTGLRIHEMLARRPDIEVLRIAADKRKDAAERARLLNAVDVAFLCLPDAAAREAAALVTNPHTCLIDASSAHRTVPGWAFGLPELAPGQRDKIRAAKRLANPGCHASAFILLLRPLVDAGIVIEQYQAGGDARLDSPRPYGLTLAHKHIPEMMAHTGLSVKPTFVPVIANFYNGLAVSVGLHFSQLKAGTNGALIRDALAKYYAGERFIRVMPLSDPAVLEGGYFDIQACNDTNRADLFVFANEQQAVLICRLDNLGKGASGAAVQAMNLHLGVDEGLGL